MNNTVKFVFPIAHLLDNKHDQENMTTTVYYENTSSNNVANIIGLIILLVAGYLAWQCNSSQTTGWRVFNTIIGMLFGMLYLIYYVIKYGLMGYSC